MAKTLHRGFGHLRAKSSFHGPRGRSRSSLSLRPTNEAQCRPRAGMSVRISKSRRWGYRICSFTPPSYATSVHLSSIDLVEGREPEGAKIERRGASNEEREGKGIGSARRGNAGSGVGVKQASSWRSLPLPPAISLRRFAAQIARWQLHNSLIGSSKGRVRLSLLIPSRSGSTG
jgi:hypothetical protein